MPAGPVRWAAETVSVGLSFTTAFAPGDTRAGAWITTSGPTVKVPGALTGPFSPAATMSARQWYCVAPASLSITRPVWPSPPAVTASFAYDDREKSWSVATWNL